MTPTITLIDTTRLKPNPNNPRKNIGDITALAGSLIEVMKEGDDHDDDNVPSRRQTARQRCKWAAACGELDAMGMLIDQLATSAGRLRDQGAPEDVLEDLTITLARLRETRKAVSSASRRLWARVEDMP